MARFIHLSDLHIHTRNKEENRYCKKLVAFIRKRYDQDAERPIVLITGDVVHGDITTESFDEQYKNAESILRPLVEDFEVLVVPGNHDYAQNGLEFNRPSHDFFNKHVLGDLIGVTEANLADPDTHHLYPRTSTKGGVLFVGLDSAIGNHRDLFQFARGALGSDQIDDLKKILAKNRADRRQVVVYFHHHPFMRDDLTMKMDDGNVVMGLLENEIDVLCFGHKHVSQTWQDQKGIEWILASGKSTEPNKNGKLQFREVAIEPRRVEVNMVVFQP